MKPRFIVHMLLSASLASLGLWLFMQMGTTSYAYIDSIFVASYWFAFLIFLFFSWFFYWILHKRSTTAWLIALVLAGLIAIAGIVAMRTVSKQYQQEVEKSEAEAMQQELEPSTSENDDIDEVQNTGDDLESDAAVEIN